jgi:hypothetical protein
MVGMPTKRQPMKESVISKPMTLAFPNKSRSFDSKRNQVRFWGYDSAIEISFFVHADALEKLIPEMGVAEAGMLKAFDAAREQIQAVADKVYSRDQKRSYAYTLAAEDF